MRIHGRIKMGHYPTPPRVVELIRNYLSFPPGQFSSLDPCCGQGDALAGLIAGTNAVTYGVELDHRRAEESKTRLHHVLRCGIEETRIQHRSCSLLLLNPPYDELTLEEEADTKTERQETSNSSYDRTLSDSRRRTGLHHSSKPARQSHCTNTCWHPGLNASTRCVFPIRSMRTLGRSSCLV